MNVNAPAANAENQTAEGNNTGDWENFSSMDWESQNWDGNVFFCNFLGNIVSEFQPF